MRVRASLLAGICASAISFPAFAQDATGDDLEDPRFSTNVIIVTAQRQNQSLQEVPIAVSAFDAAALEAQQIENASDLQLTLPNVSFTKSNFTSSSFTIRGIGDLCVGVTCDSATAIHTNGSPLFGTRLFETEYFDLERVEVLRGPQGTLFGRNATSGVVNVVTAKPELGTFAAAAEFEYGNYKSIKTKGMINVPLGDTLAFRAAGFYLNRDGYTTNLYDGNDIDGRDMYAVRGSLRFEPTASTTLDLMAFYFRENDDRLRIQKQTCQRDPTGVLGCLNNRRDFDSTNANSTLASVLTSQELFRIQGIPDVLALGSVYGPDGYANFDEPNDVRTVNTAFTPEYFADELQLQAHLDQGFGAMNLSLTGIYQETTVDSRQDYNLGVLDRSGYAGALNTLAFFAANGLPTGVASPAFIPGSNAYFAPIADALIPDGPAGVLCTSDNDDGNLGAFEGNSLCADVPLAFDRSVQYQTAWSGEAILSSDFDGPFNFLVGGIYAETEVSENSYYVNGFGLDYATAILGTFSAFGAGAPPSYLATSMYRNNTTDFKLESFGIFGEVYVDISDRLRFTGGIRYNDDSKTVSARTTLADFLNPFGNGDPFTSPFVGSFDADAGIAGNQLLQERDVSFDAITGRAVLDYEISPDNKVYFSYSRGYKSGGINPPLSPIFAVSDSFDSEQIDAFEIGSKNTFLNGSAQVNLTGFYYKYKDLQLSRIVARTSVNDTIDANIWGLELETILRPSYNWLINMNVSYLNAKVAGDQFFSNPRDPGGGDPDAVIIKDLSNGSLCAVTGAGANAFVGAVNAGLGLQAPTAFPADGGIASTGAFSICSVLDAQTANPAFAPLGPISVLSPGVEVNLRGNRLPQAPEYKASIGVQYTADFDNGMSLVPRFDLAYTGEQFGNVFNGNVNRIEPFVQANASIQLNGADNRWFVRGFVQNIFDSNSVTGLYVTDASSGNFTNIFTLDPRRYGIAVGAKF
ncbi:MAG: TonB-dependent receptor [Erythrobacter sp.]|jgi:iron complex outermembrane recepter protein|uniref:TonB-dependent receptor n=1 Tax=Qipengyuania citrea TaxID=225971 RepID=UPI001A4C46FB|nr:TonB-dependent receptor [Qipengyuania citrea]MBL4716849.1 TonB-dependent receptor [Erythrobacter sp.]MCP2018910.1 outer membrane receptor protein involved in Fe transport [Qipengyuania citrea]MDE0902251.1 TonB-dependent receptor [Erythrobacter sp.]